MQRMRSEGGASASSCWLVCVKCTPPVHARHLVLLLLPLSYRTMHNVSKTHVPPRPTFRCTLHVWTLRVCVHAVIATCPQARAQLVGSISIPLVVVVISMLLWALRCACAPHHPPDAPHEAFHACWAYWGAGSTCPVARRVPATAPMFLNNALHPGMISQLIRGVLATSAAAIMCYHSAIAPMTYHCCHPLSFPAAFRRLTNLAAQSMHPPPVS